jgi:hypothetical protein
MHRHDIMGQQACAGTGNTVSPLSIHLNPTYNNRVASKAVDPRTDPDVPSGMSIELLKDLHLLTRDGHLNADARRKLKQIRHLVGLLKPGLDDVLSKCPEPAIVDCGAGKSYLGFLLCELVLAKANQGTLYALESRPELVAQGAKRATQFGHQRLRFVDGKISESSGSVGNHTRTLPERLHVVTALHACDTATDDALYLAITSQADYVAVVPCCQAEVARQLQSVSSVRSADSAYAALFEHNLHRREFGSHVTNVIRALCLQAHGYHVTVTELVGWEHSAKNELILGKRTKHHSRQAASQIDELTKQFNIRPKIVNLLAGRGT